MSMERLEAWVELLYEEKICDEFDRVVPIVADEGMGKSTLILQLMVLWKRQTDQDIEIDELIDQLVYSRDGFKDALASYPPRTVIPVPDAARVLYKKESMDSEQIELEKDLLDVRTKEHLILLGFQDWDIIPSFLQKRRAKNLFYIPMRGQVWGYNRKGIDERRDEDSWPDPQMKAQFPSLEGTELWRRYKREDRQRKEERMRRATDKSDSDDPTDVVDQIKEDGIENVIGMHGGWNREYIDPDLIELRYDLSRRNAKKVKKLLQADSDIETPDAD